MAIPVGRSPMYRVALMIVAAGYKMSPGRRSRPRRRLARSYQALSATPVTGVADSSAVACLSQGAAASPTAPIPVARRRARRLTPRDGTRASDEVLPGMGFLAPPPYEVGRRPFRDRSFVRAPSYQSGDMTERCSTMRVAFWSRERTIPRTRRFRNAGLAARFVDPVRIGNIEAAGSWQ
jgi:hypothetical protein